MTRRTRIKCMGLIGVGLILAVAGYIEFHFHLPEGSGPAGPAVPLEPFDKPWTDKKVLLLGVGDSVTAGFGAKRGHSYFDLLVQNPENEFEDMRGRSLSPVIPNLQTRNIAVSGSDSRQHVEHVQKKLEWQ